MLAAAVLAIGSGSETAVGDQATVVESARAPTAPARTDEPPAPAAPTRLPLRLTGVVLAGPPQGARAFALIEEGGRTRVVHEGGALDDGRRLLRVEADRVIVVDDSRRTTALAMQPGQGSDALPAPLALPTLILSAAERAPRSAAADAGGLAPEPAADAN
jgi:type II secretory pathway component PulC